MYLQTVNIFVLQTERSGKIMQCCSYEIRLPAANQIKVAQRRCKAPYAVSGIAGCALPSDQWLKFQTAIAAFSAGT